MIYRTLTITTTLLATWITYSVHQNQQAITQLEQSSAISLEQSTAFQAAVMEEYAGITEFIKKQDSSEKLAAEAIAKVDQQKQLTELFRVYSNVLTAELLSKNGKLPEAAEKLKATKDKIWQSGDRFPNHKEALQGLMQPIDETAAKWEGGDAEGTVETVSTTLEKILEALVKG